MASTATGASTEARELTLIGKVELRIALADTDAKLEALLGTYMVPLLLKLTSEHVAVRNKVIAICQHLNTRLKSPSIKLPVLALLKQYKDTKSPLLRHFDLLYLQQGLPRQQDLEDTVDFAASLTSGLAEKFVGNPRDTATLLHIFLRLLPQIPMPARGSSEDDLLPSRFVIELEDADFLALWLGRLFLFTSTAPANKPLPGLSSDDVNFLQIHGKEAAWKPAQGGLSLPATKHAAVNFLASRIFTAQQRLIPALYATVNPDERISSVGEDMLKRALADTSLEDKALIQNLYRIYLNAGNSDATERIKSALQARILSLLTKSIAAAQYPDEIVEIVSRGLTPEAQTQATDPTVKRSGLEESKLTKAIFSFVNWVCRVAPPVQLESIGPVLVNKIRLHIMGQGWPQIESVSDNPTEVAARQLGYESIGLLAKACPHKSLFEPSMELLRWLFQSLTSDNTGNETALSIEQALGSSLAAFERGYPAELDAALADLLLSHVSSKPGQASSEGMMALRSAKYTAVRFANRCLPFSNVKARWMDLSALSSLSGERPELSEEGRRGLEPDTFSSAFVDDTKSVRSRSIPPDFEALVGFVFDSIRARSITENLETAVEFCSAVLFHAAIDEKSDGTPRLDDWTRSATTAIQTDQDARDHLKDYFESKALGSSPTQSAIDLLLNVAFRGFTNVERGKRQYMGRFCLDLAMLYPPAFRDIDQQVFSHLVAARSSNDREIRETASHLIGIIARKSDALHTSVQDLCQQCMRTMRSWREVVGAAVFDVCNSILSIAFLLSRCETTTSLPDLSEFLTLLSSIMQESRDREMKLAVVGAVQQLSLAAMLKPLMTSPDVEAIKTELVGMAKSGEESAVLALAYLAMQIEKNHDESTNQDSTIRSVIESLLALHEQRQVELQFSVGYALSCIAAGWESRALVGFEDLRTCTESMPARQQTLPQLLQRVLADCAKTKPSLRQAASIWLLSLCQYCGHLPALTSQLKACQQAFKGFLADRDTVTQEAASRGLAIIYEQGDSELRATLVRDLVGSFTASSSTLSGKVDEDTQLFEPGGLPTSDGSVTTYKDIVNLANEVGDPALVYRFMSLASNSSIWSSRAALGRFGLGKILSDSANGEYLAHNLKVYATLYRYKFDPNTNVRAAMDNIWTALVKDPQSVLDQQFDYILGDVLKNILGKEWRTRQACCAALGDLVQRFPLLRYETHLVDIWSKAFKVCDDIKGSVRMAAMTLVRTLTGILTRGLESAPKTSAKISESLAQLLPFLLGTSGLESSAKETQAFALKAIMDIVKTSTPLLRPFLPQIICQLLALLSSIEPEAINYLRLNADKYSMTEQQIDDARLSSVKMSPMMEVIEKCLDLLVSESMGATCNSLAKTARTLIGLPSRVGLSRVIVSLCTRRPFLFKPYASSFLKTLRPLLIDRNDTVSTSTAMACGYLARMATEEALLRHVEHAQYLYFETAEDRRIVAGELMLAFAKHATDRYASIASETTPLTFFGKHSDGDAGNVFQAAWDESTGGSRSILLYLSEILALCEKHVDSGRWPIKHAAALSIADAAQAAASSSTLGDVSLVWRALQAAVKGKTWDGKEKVLEAIVTFAKGTIQAQTQSEIAEQIKTLLIKECERRNVTYRSAAFSALSTFMSIYSVPDWWPIAIKLARPVWDEMNPEADAMDVDSTETEDIKNVASATALKVILRSIDPTKKHGSDLDSAVQEACILCRKALTLPSHSVRDTVIDELSGLFTRLHSTELSGAIDQDFAQTMGALQQQNDQRESTREKAAKCLIQMASLDHLHASTKADLRTTLEGAISTERAASVLLQLRKAQTYLSHPAQPRPGDTPS